MAVTGAAATLVVCLAGAASAGDEGGALFGKDYRSKSIVKNGERYELVDAKRMNVSFFRGGRSDGIGWYAGCNHFWTDVRIRERRLIVRSPGQTLIGCAHDQVRQDEWFARFFKRDPLWRRDGRDLNLISRSRDDVIRLRAR